jgi:hypothetical protein
MRIPASVAYSLPAATAPCVPREGDLTSRAAGCLCCPKQMASSRIDRIATLSFVMLFLL